MRKKIINLLQLVKIKEDEIAVYLQLLKLKQATASQLIDNTEMHFITVYRILKSLQDRGLVTAKSVNKKQKIYKPLSLNQLIKDIRLEKNKLNWLEKELKNIDTFLPFIDMNDNEVKEEKIEIKFGVDAMREEYMKLPSLCEDEMLPIGNVDNYCKLTNHSIDCPEERSFVHQRFRKGIYVRMMNTPNELSEELKRRDSLEKRTMRLIEKLPITNNFLVITKDQSTLFICDKNNPQVVLTKEPELLSLQRAQFESYWNN